MFRRSLQHLSAFSLFGVLALSVGSAQNHRLIAGAIDNRSRLTLINSTHPQIRGAEDVGPVDPGTKLERLMLVLGSSDSQEQALRARLDSLHDKTSPNYQHWLTPEQVAEQFAPAVEDLTQIESWLQAYGLRVTGVARSRRWIEFSGTAQQVDEAFQTHLRKYRVAGTTHVANANDISIPAAMAPAVKGVLSLHDFFRKPMVADYFQARRDSAGAWQFSNPDGTFNTVNGPVHLLTPGDYSAIYNLAPLYKDGLDGTGQTIAIVARSSVRLPDVRDFRRIFNLPANDPHIIFNGPEAGFLNFNDEVEADLDMEWAGSIAPQATIDLVISGSTVTTDGVDLSAAYIVDNNLASVMSVSFGNCEQNATPAENAFFNSLWEQASLQGISVIVSSGDNGAAGCDIPSSPNNAPATGGLAVNALASTSFNTAVGGTQFAENGQDTEFWNPTNSAGFVSARGYIPEAVWNESCNPTTSSTCPNQHFSLLAGSGGASTLYAKPSWQNGVGVPADGKRDLPDVSLTAAGGHDGYLVCFIGSCQTQAGGTGLVLVGATVVGGTSAAAPAFAGIMALVNQKTGTRQGLANYILYRLAANESATDCNSSSLTDPASPSPCVFYDITAGNNTVPGLSGFSALPGFDLASGLGSVNGGNLVNSWNSAIFQGSTTSLTANTVSGVHGQPIPISVTVQSSSGTGTPTGSFLLTSDKFGAAGVGPLTAGSFTGSFATLPGGQYNLTAHYQGDGVFGASDSIPVAINISPENSTVTLTSWQFGALGPFQTANIGYSDFLFFHVVVASASGNGAPTGTVTFSDGATVLGTIKLSGSGEGDFSNNCFGPFFGVTPVTCLDLGTHSIVATYSGDNSFNSSSSAALNVTVAKGTTSLLLNPSQTAMTTGQEVTLQASVGGGPTAPTGTVQFFDNGSPIGSLVTIAPKVSGSRPQAILQTGFAAGTHVLTASYSGDNLYNPNSSLVFGPVTITVTAPGGAATQTTATVDKPNATVGDVVTYHVVVSSAVTTPPISGTIDLISEFGELRTPVAVVNGVADVPLQWSFAGAQSAIAQYSGDANHAPSGSAPVIINLARSTPLISVAASSTSVQSGQQVTLSATVRSQIQTIITGVVGPTSAIQFFDALNGGPPQPLGPPRFPSIADRFTIVLSLPAVLPDGVHVITAQYLQDAIYASAISSPITVTVAPATFHLSASSPGMTIVAGQSAGVNLTVTPAPGLNTTVTLSCGGGLPAGATCSISPSSLLLTGTPASAVLTIGTTAPASASNHRTPFWWLSSSMGLACICLFGFAAPTRQLARFSSVIAVIIVLFSVSCGGGGGAANPGPTPAPSPSGVPTSTALSSSALKQVNGSPVTLTATVSSAASAPTGTVAFFDGAGQIGSAPLNNGQARLQLLSLGVGTHSLTAKYNGDSHNQPSTSTALQQTVTGTQQLQVTATAGGQAQTTSIQVTVQ